MSLKTSPISVRASAALPAAGAYDTASTATVIDAKAYSFLELRINYTRGGVGGSAKFKVLVASDNTSQTVFYERTIDDGTINVSSNGASYSNVYTSEKQLPVASGAATESRTFIIDVSTARYVKILFAEVGAVATPGILDADCITGEDE